MTTGTRRQPSEYDFGKQLFDEQLIPTEGSGRRSTYPRGGTVKHIDIHHMTIHDSTNGAALPECTKTWETRQASAHYGIDNNYIAQFVYDNRMAWADADLKANQEGIAIEHANSATGDPSGWPISDTTIGNSVKLVAALHVTHKLGRPTSKGFGTSGTIRTHSSFYATACPGPYFKKIWSAYVVKCQQEYDRITGAVVTPPVSPTVTSVWGQPDTFVLGAVGQDVVRLGERIVIWSKFYGLPSPYKVGPSSPLGPADVQGLSAIQKKHWPNATTALGGDADGYPGPETFAFLATDPAPSVPIPPVVKSATVTSADINLAGNNAHGIATAVSRVKKYVAARKVTPVDIINCQETTVASLVRPRMDSGLKPLNYKRRAGGEGRYQYANDTVKYIAGEMITAKSTTWYKKDDKQASVIVYEKNGIRAMDVSWHLESDSGAVPDQKRIDQALNILTQVLEYAKKYSVALHNILITGDTNSNGLVKAAMAKKGWRSISDGTKFEHTYTFRGWDGKSLDIYDYGFVYDPEGVKDVDKATVDAKTVAIAWDPKISDHASVRFERVITAA